MFLYVAIFWIWRVVQCFSYYEILRPDLQCGDQFAHDLTQVPSPSEGCERSEGGRHQADHHVRHRHVADVHVGARPQLRSPGGDGYHQTGTLLVTHSDVADASSLIPYRHSK